VQIFVEKTDKEFLKIHKICVHLRSIQRREKGVLRKEKELARKRRKKRVSAKVRGTPERPRLCVFRTSRHIYAQVIDDSRGHTLASASTLNAPLRPGEGGKGKIEAAKKVGIMIAARAIARQVQKVSFDRNGFLYHGRVQALAEAAREKGLDF
jgi:large subunit ribosomal protein L18